jgi:quercetin dioxygenase-like cupin family protein
LERQVGTQAGDDALTTGSQVRPARDLAEPVVIDVAREAATLFDEPQWQERGRNSRTISTTERMRVTVIALRAGEDVGNEGTDDTLAVQLLRGRATLELAGRTVDLAEGQLATAAQPASWRLRADEDALLLLTVALDRGPSATDLDDA